MANTPVIVLDDRMTNIANAIRSKTGGTATMTPGQMPAQIASIPSGVGVGIPREVSVTGVYQMPSGSFIFSLPSNVTDVGAHALQYAFYGCTSLKDITFEAGITTIGQAAVYDCTSLKTVTFKSGVTTIKTYAFYGCSALNQIYLPVSLRTVETYAFYNCSSLTNGYIYYTGTSSNKSSISVASNNNPFKNSNWVYSSAVVLSLRKPVYELVAYDEAINMIALEKTVLTDEIEGAVIAEVNVDDILLAQGYALVDGAESDWLYVTDSNDYCGYVNKQYLSILETEETISYEKNAFDKKKRV